MVAEKFKVGGNVQMYFHPPICVSSGLGRFIGTMSARESELAMIQ